MYTEKKVLMQNTKIESLFNPQISAWHVCQLAKSQSKLTSGQKNICLCNIITHLSVMQLCDTYDIIMCCECDVGKSNPMFGLDVSSLSTYDVREPHLLLCTQYAAYFHIIIIKSRHNKTADISVNIIPKSFTNNVGLSQLKLLKYYKVHVCYT